MAVRHALHAASLPVTMAAVNGWTFFYLMVVLKIPIIALLAIVWWAIRKEPDGGSSGNGGSPVSPSRPPVAPRPRPARRGPHEGPQPLPPARVRSPRPRERETA